MLATYTVTGEKPTYHKTGVTRQYYIQAVSADCLQRTWLLRTVFIGGNISGFLLVLQP